ncbi:MAG: hypothetical protein CMC23_00290 [Flavobacteriaceae bacterium]|nr:hypothetical protein [Flavobacteriaceae bacterium]|tara:strand:+ start:1165 stop:1488 length:324 start_codon:yes stop_codon:yes gene_type:complete
MKMDNSTVINLCGNYPENFEKADVLSDPDYIFKNDPSYQAIQLYDNELNSVYVNSFIECEHYVLGGWDNSPTQFNEISFHNSLSLIMVGALIVRFLVKKIFVKYADN